MDISWIFKAHIVPFFLGLKDVVVGLCLSCQLFFYSSIVKWRLFYLFLASVVQLIFVLVASSAMAAARPYLPSIPLPYFLDYTRNLDEDPGNSPELEMTLLWSCYFLLLWLLSTVMFLVVTAIIRPVICFCYLDVSSEVNRHFKTTTACKFAKDQDLVSAVKNSIADTMYSICLYSVFMLQTTLVEYIPMLGFAIGLLHQALLVSVFSFDYPWFSQGISIFHRVEIVRKHWTYFVGFGSPIVLLALLPAGYSGALYALCFPAFIVAATLTRLPKANSVSTPIPVPFFYVPLQVTERFIGTVISRLLNRVYQG